MLLLAKLTCTFRKFEFQIRDRKLKTTAKNLQNKGTISDIINRGFKEEAVKNKFTI